MARPSEAVLWPASTDRTEAETVSRPKRSFVNMLEGEFERSWGKNGEGRHMFSRLFCLWIVCGNREQRGRVKDGPLKLHKNRDGCNSDTKLD